MVVRANNPLGHARRLLNLLKQHLSKFHLPLHGSSILKSTGGVKYSLVRSHKDCLYILVSNSRSTASSLVRRSMPLRTSCAGVPFGIDRDTDKVLIHSVLNIG